LKILLITGIYPPDIGGPATYIPKLAKFLQEKGDYVEVLTLRDEGTYHRNYSPWPINYIERQIPTPLRFLRVAFWIARKGRRFDTIFANGLHEEVALGSIFSRNRIVAKVVGDPVWERARNTGKTKLEISEFSRIIHFNPARKFQRKLLVWSLNQFNEIIAPSQDLINLMTNWGVETNISYVPNGVLVPRLKEVNKKYDLISVSRLVPWKNLDLVVKAIANTDVIFLVVGSGPDQTYLETLAKDLSAKVFFCGEKTEDEIEILIQESLAFIQPSSYEGQSFAMLKSMSLGVPCLLSPIQANKAVVTDKVDGLLFDSFEVSSIRELILLTLSDKKLRDSIGNSARETISADYSLDSNLSILYSMVTHD